MSCKGDWRGRSEAKDVVRERAWAALEASGDARDDDGPRGRIPDFVGAEEAAAALAETPEWQQARIVLSFLAMPLRTRTSPPRRTSARDFPVRKSA